MVHVVVVIRCIVVFIIFLNCFKTYSGITSRIPVTGGINNFLLVCRNWLSYAYWRSDYIQSSSSIYWWAQLTSLILSNITSVSFWSLLDIKLKFYTFLPVSRCFRWNIYKRSRIKSKWFSIEVANNRRSNAFAMNVSEYHLVLDTVQDLKFIENLGPQIILKSARPAKLVSGTLFHHISYSNTNGCIFAPASHTVSIPRSLESYKWVVCHSSQ